MHAHSKYHIICVTPLCFASWHRYEEALAKLDQVIKIKEECKVGKVSTVKTFLNKVETLFALENFTKADEMYYNLCTYTYLFLTKVSLNKIKDEIFRLWGLHTYAALVLEKQGLMYA